MEKVLTQDSPVRTVNPYNGQVERIFELTTDQEIDRILEDADTAFRAWRQTSVAERAALMRSLARAFRANRNELSRLAAVEMGKVLGEGLVEVDLCARVFEYYARHGKMILKDRPMEFPRKAYMQYEPIGVILSIQPWNFPYSQVIRNAAPVIMAGNTMVLKHSSNVPQCAEMIERIFSEAGAPEGLFTNLYIKGAKASEIIADPRIKGATFTGGVAAGRSVAEACGRVAKKCVMELSGIDPMIVLDDADVDFAVKTGIGARIRNAGQVCNAPKRMIVAEPLVERFIAGAVAMLDDIVVGDPLDENTAMGPVSSVKTARTIKSQVEKSVKQGAKIVEYKGYSPARKGALIMPTLLIDVEPGMEAFDEEIFGPVIAVVAARDEAHAIELANRSRFALGASVFSTDKRRAERVARQIDCGMIGINTMAGSTPELPYGGTKDSGYGRELSEYGVYEFMNHKLIRY